MYKRQAGNQLTELDVHKNLSLTTLNCAINQISVLNLLSNTDLESLDCQSNSIEYLDLSQNSALYKVLCNDNTLLGLNIKNGSNTNILNQDFAAFANASLTCIQVDAVSYSNTNWAQIDMQTSFSENCSPVNDNCSFTVPIVLGQDTPGSTISASGAATNPNCAQSGVTVYDVWYSFIAPESGAMNISIDAGTLVSKICLLYTSDAADD